MPEGFPGQVYAYMKRHPSGDGWMVMARPTLKDNDGNDFPFHPVGRPEDRFIPASQRSPRQYSEGEARTAVKRFEAEMRVPESEVTL